jgi:KDO2-lipid IV(A) lauroyltransferase
MAHFLFDLIRGIIRFTPYPIFRAKAWVIAWVLYLVSPKLRRYAIESLSTAFGDAISLQEKKKIARRAFFSLTLGLADLIFYIARPGRAADAFVLEGAEHLKVAHDAGKGAVIAVAHFGPFVAMLFKLLYEGHTVRIVMRAPRNKIFADEIMTREALFVPHPIYSTPLRECVVACFSALRQNEILVMPVDQNYGGPGRVFVDFFGHKAATAVGPAAYAFKTGAPLFSAFAYPLRSGKWRIKVEPVVLDRTQPERDAVYAATQELTTRVESAVRAYPGEWVWMHRRWKAVPRPGEI